MKNLIVFYDNQGFLQVGKKVWEGGMDIEMEGKFGTCFIPKTNVIGNLKFGED